MTTQDRNTRTFTATFATISCCALLLLSACGSGTAGAGGETTDATQAVASPLETALGFGADSGDFEAKIAEEERRIEASVTQCMTDQGFEYTPNAGAAEISLADPDPATDGYGFATSFEQFTSGMDGPGGDPTADLSQSEREAYETALWGEAPDLGEDSSEFTPGGCYGDAFGESTLFATFEELGTEFEELERRIEADPRMVQASESWSACMREAGHDFATPDDASSHAEAELTTFMDALFANPSTDAFSGPELSDEQRRQLDELQEAEIKLAVADETCAKDIEARVAEVRAEYEQPFVDEHSEQLSKVAS